MILPSTKTNQEQAPSTITEPPSSISTPMDSADGNGDQTPSMPRPKYNRNPLVPIGLDVHDPPTPVSTPPAPAPTPAMSSIAPRQYAPNPLSSMSLMDTAEDVTKATANVANLFRSVSLDVDPCQEGPSTATPSIPDSPTRSRQSKPDGKRSKSCMPRHFEVTQSL